MKISNFGTNNVKTAAPGKLSASQIRDIIVNNGAPAQVENICLCRIDAESAMRFTLEHF